MLLSPLIVYITTHCLTVANIGSFFVTAKRNAIIFASRKKKKAKTLLLSPFASLSNVSF